MPPSGSNEALGSDITWTLGRAGRSVFSVLFTSFTIYLLQHFLILCHRTGNTIHHSAVRAVLGGWDQLDECLGRKSVRAVYLFRLFRVPSCWSWSEKIISYDIGLFISDIMTECGKIRTWYAHLSCRLCELSTSWVLDLFQCRFN